MAKAAGAKVPESIKINNNLAVRRCMGWSVASARLSSKEYGTAGK